MVYTQKKHRSRETWLQARSGSIGASLSAGIMGADRWNTELRIYGELTGDLPPKEQTMAMKMGNRLEPVIAGLYADEAQAVCIDPGEFTIQRSPLFPWLHCTVDRFISFSRAHRDLPGVLEEKAPGSHMADDWADGIPLGVQIQIQHQLAVTGLEWGSAAALIGGQTFVWGDVERNQAFIDELLKQTREFWERVNNREPPEAQAADVTTLRLLYEKYEPATSIMLPGAAVTHDEMMQQLAEEIKTAERARNWHKAKLLEMIGPNEIGELPGGGSYTWKTVNRKAHEVKASSHRELRRHK